MSDYSASNNESSHAIADAQFDHETEKYAENLYEKERLRVHSKVDKCFVALFCVQWPVAIALALFMTPVTWAGSDISTAVHVYLAVGLGALATLLPLWLALRCPGEGITRHVIAASAVLFSVLFIHLSSGRDEGYFHFFMMMAFVTSYFDWKVVLTAVAVGALDQVLGALIFPMSVFGVLESPWFQLFRHIVWTAFAGTAFLYAAALIDRYAQKSAFHLAAGKLREKQISTLLNENQRVEEERREQQNDIHEAAETKRQAEQDQREAADASAAQQLAESARITQQVNALLSSVNLAAKGDLGVEITVKGNDPIGQVGSALEKMLASLRDNFEQIGASANTLTEAARDLTATSKDLSNDTTQTSDEVQRVSSSAKQINSGVQNTASSTEQMNEAIREVSRCASEAESVGQEAVNLASQATSTVEQLGVSSSDIGDVLKVITSIAEQTNLLALNATIEAARAGDAGKGFAVVANEVKELAKETAKATDEISTRIAAIQADARNAGTVIGQISTIIEQIENYSTTVATAVEEQTATTREISKNVRHSAEGSDDITRGIEVIVNKIAHTSQSANNVDACAVTLGKIANRLNHLLSIYSTANAPRVPSLQVVSSR